MRRPASVPRPEILTVHSTRTGNWLLSQLLTATASGADPDGNQPLISSPSVLERPAASAEWFCPRLEAAALPVKSPLSFPVASPSESSTSSLFRQLVL